MKAGELMLAIENCPEARQALEDLIGVYQSLPFGEPIPKDVVYAMFDLCIEWLNVSRDWIDG